MNTIKQTLTFNFKDKNGVVLEMSITGLKDIHGKNVVLANDDIQLKDYFELEKTVGDAMQELFNKADGNTKKRVKSELGEKLKKYDSTAKTETEPSEKNS